jgi:hypothetical protein
MTPSIAPPGTPSRGTGVIVFVVSFVVGLGCFGFLGGVVSYAFVEKARVDVRRGWTLVPTTVAAKRLTPGSIVKMADLSNRSVPEMLVTASMITPESASTIVNQAILVSVEPGEPLRWAFFAAGEGLDSRADHEAFEACTRTVWGPP